ncbi:LOW QUALITY PROTEIN: ubinuclein-1-like [Branchiostoma floridae]|uniref:LOW QUALITY PROTEIN: ubinuclein-1-like n=1 Tax=Branchiostoma floridae TaxID=7739 RepID=A0A9J7LH84_BRAFL|nr:LOW QUALITY PROTEIN: ubinuclein-1-like [Branchiostoma floridae]
MAEAKRIVPIPLKGMKPLNKEKKEKSTPPRAPTLRFALNLTPSTDKTCPEISYVDLVKNAMCKDKDSRPTPNKDAEVIDSDDPFAAADAKEIADVERIARHFEEKYGPSTVSKSAKGKRRDRIQDLVDMGLGYDETDPFVDNSECYDELVPADITTKLGGFYINSGVLEFRDVSDSDSEGNFKAPGVKRKTPKILSDSEDSGGDFKDATKKKRKMRKPSKDGVEKDGVRKRKRLKDPLDPNKPKKPRKPREKGDGTTKPRKKSTPTVAELLQRQQQLHQPGQNPLTTSNSTSPPSAGLPIHNSNMSPSNLLASAGFGTLGRVCLFVCLFVCRTTSNSTSPPSAGLPIHNSNMSPSNLLASAGFGTLAGGDAGSSLLTSSILSGLTDVSQGAGDGINPEKPPNLPTGLPSDLQTTIVKLKEAAEMSSDGKCKFFTPSVNSMLLDVEMQSRELKCSERSGVFAHLAAHLPCTKDTLLKRAKKLRHSELDSQLREPLFRLREAIGKVMPEQIRRHQEECKIATQAKIEQIQESQQSLHKDGEQENPAGSTSDEDEEGTKNSLDNIKIKRSSMPRRKFEWTDEIRKLLYEVVRIKVQHYDKSRSQSAEEYLKTYLEQEVKNCWPKGWMQARMLFKESRCIHNCITAQPPKQKKIQVNPAPKKAAIVKFGLDHPPHVWGWSQQVGQTEPWDPAVSRQERKAPSPGGIPSGIVGANNSTPPSQTFPKPVAMTTSTPASSSPSALQSMSLFASCVTAEKQHIATSSTSLPNAPALTSSIASFIPTLLDYADLDGSKTKPKEFSPPSSSSHLKDSPTDNSIGNAIDAVVRQARSHSQPAQDLTAVVKASPPQIAAKKPASDVVRPTMKSPPSVSSQPQQQRPPSDTRSQFGKSFQALFEQSIQQAFSLPKQGEGASSQPARQQPSASGPQNLPTTTSPYAQFQTQIQSSQPKAKPQSYTKPQFQTSTQASMYSSKSQPQTLSQAPMFSSKSQPPQTSPQAPLFSSKSQPQTSPQASLYSSKGQSQTSPQAPLYSSKGQPQTAAQAPMFSSKGQPFPSQGQTSPFERTTQGSPKTGMSLTHGNQSSLTHGNQSNLAHVNQSSLTHGKQVSLTHGSQSSLTHSNQASLTHGSQSSLTHGNQSSLTHGNQSSLTHGNQSILTHSNQASLTHGSQSSLPHGNQSSLSHGNQSHGNQVSLTHGNQARQSGLSHSSPNLSPHGQGYNPTSPLSHQKPAGYTPTSPLSHQKPAGYTPTSPLSHQKPTGYSTSSPKFTSSLASMGGIAPDLSSFQLPGLTSLPQPQRGSGRPSLSQAQLTHPTTQALPVYQMGLADPRRDQSSPAGGQRVAMSDAIITGPAPGTFNHVQAFGPGRGPSSKVKGQPPTVTFQVPSAGGSLPPFGTLRSSPTRQQYPGNQFSQAFSVPESLGSGRHHDIMACLSRPGSGGGLPKEAKNQSHSSNNSTSPHRQIQ